MSDKEDIKKLIQRQILVNREGEMLIETFQYMDYPFLIEDLPFMSFDYTLIAASTENFNEKIINSYKNYNIKLANDSSVSILHTSPYYFLFFSDQEKTSQKGDIREYPTQYTLSPELVTSYNKSIVDLWRAYKVNLLTPKMLGINRYQDCPHKTGQECFSFFINEDFKDQNLILKSYFEIILWSAYKPDVATFKITDSKGQIKKMSFTSLVDNRQYQIKCNIEFPYCYKIKAL